MKIKAQIERMVNTDSKVKAYASANLDGEFVIKDISVTEGKNGLFARMPHRSYKDSNGKTQYSDTVFGLTDDARANLNDAVLSAYEQKLQEEQSHEQSADETPAQAQTM